MGQTEQSLHTAGNTSNRNTVGIQVEIYKYPFYIFEKNTMYCYCTILKFTFI